MLVAARAAEDGGESDSLLASRIATLESWQLRRLKQAHFLGKHQRSIKQLAGDLNMDRCEGAATKGNPSWYQSGSLNPL